MLEMPDADPTCSSGTELVPIDEHGPFENAMPAATSTIGRTKAP